MASHDTSANTASLSLMTIPTEIRLEILSHTGLVSPRGGPIIINDDIIRSSSEWPTELFFICRQLHVEACEMFLSRNRLLFLTRTPLKTLRFLNLLDKQMLKQLRNLTFHIEVRSLDDISSNCFSEKDWRTLMLFVAQNLYLPSLTLWITLDMTSIRKVDHPNPFVSKVSEIIESVIEICGLKKLKFVLPVLRVKNREAKKELLGVEYNDIWFRYEGRFIEDGGFGA